MKKTALVSGASRGIGRAIAIKLAEAGYDLYITCLHSKEELMELRAELESKYNVSCKASICDMGNDKEVELLFEDIKKLDLLINNAGISYIGIFSEMKTEEWHKIIDTNLGSVFYACRMAVPLMLKEHNGRIINISSVWGEAGASMEVAYSASKGGINSLTKALAKELAPSHICVNAIACGMIDTDMNGCLSEEDKESIREEIPADRFGSPAEVAEMVLHIAEAPEYMTGQIIRIDGGWH